MAHGVLIVGKDGAAAAVATIERPFGCGKPSITATAVTGACGGSIGQENSTVTSTAWPAVTGIGPGPSTVSAVSNVAIGVPCGPSRVMTTSSVSTWTTRN